MPSHFDFKGNSIYLCSEVISPSDLLLFINSNLMNSIDLVKIDLAVTKPNKFAEEIITTFEQQIEYNEAPPELALILPDINQASTHPEERLWNSVDALLPTQHIHFFTRDVTFTSNHRAEKVLLVDKSDSGEMETSQVSFPSGISRHLFLRCLMSKKDIILVEGVAGSSSSFDQLFYEPLFPNFHIISAGSAGAVIAAIKALNSSALLTRKKRSFGIVDLDRRSDEEVKSLEEFGVHALKVAELESFFCTDEMLQLTAEKLGYNPDDIITQAHERAFSLLQNRLTQQTCIRVTEDIRKKLRKFRGLQSLDALEEELQTVADIEVAALYQKHEADLKTALSTNDYDLLLRLFNDKGLLVEQAKLFKLKPKTLIQKVIHWLHTDKDFQSQTLKILKAYLSKANKLSTLAKS